MPVDFNFSFSNFGDEPLVEQLQADGSILQIQLPGYIKYDTILLRRRDYWLNNLAKFLLICKIKKFEILEIIRIFWERAKL